ncbi:TPA: MotA/TolQ/ExbB proton channel family protein [bacterium]|nr:MAG: MotA/TolQ/ExbB proton channel family protein [Candidatus Hydrogenedentes bacterium CG07_land_8_20_14_0_80_42_17]HBW46536.1 MotA/TolQ/ExbB proton channel family protein [bacterium]
MNRLIAISSKFILASIIFLIFFSIMPAFSQETSSVPAGSENKNTSAESASSISDASAGAESIGEYYTRGGFVMHFILFSSVVAAAISIERLYHFRRAKTDHRRLLADIKTLLADELVYKAMARCDEDKGPVAHVLKTVLKNMDKDSETIRDAVDVAGLEEIPRLERHLYALATIANVATLLGLLGTILGMIVTFSAIAATTTGVVNVHVLSNGIWQAMLTTAFGLMVAIPTTLVHAYLNNEVKKFSIAMEHSSAELVHYLQHRPGQGNEI